MPDVEDASSREEVDEGVAVYVPNRRSETCIHGDRQHPRIAACPTLKLFLLGEQGAGEGPGKWTIYYWGWSKLKVLEEGVLLDPLAMRLPPVLPYSSVH